MSDKYDSVSLLCRDSVLDRETIYVPSHLKIDGTVYHNIECHGRLMISSTATIHGNIKSRDLVVEGDVKGTIWSSGKVTISRSARVVGSVSARKIRIEEGAWCQIDTCIDEEAPERMNKADLSVENPDIVNRDTDRVSDDSDFQKSNEKTTADSDDKDKPESTEEQEETENMTNRFW